MQALGNDFVILEVNALTPAQIRWIADRRRGIGCDQVILVNPSTVADATLSFYNTDGSEALACGNGTRCVVKYLGKDSGTLQTPSCLSEFWRKGEAITISLKEPEFSEFFPKLSIKGCEETHYINVGNPHVVIFTHDIESLSLETIAPLLQPPDGINVELAQVISPSILRVKVWERGVGITSACGSGACAVGILSLKLGLVKDSSVSLEMDGGVLEMTWEEGNPPLLTGPAEFCFKGIIDLP